MLGRRSAERFCFEDGLLLYLYRMLLRCREADFVSQQSGIYWISLSGLQRFFKSSRCYRLIRLLPSSCNLQEVGINNK